MANHKLVLGHGQNAELALGQNHHNFCQDNGLGLGYGHDHDHELVLGQSHDDDMVPSPRRRWRWGRAEERKGEWRMGRVWVRGLDKIASGRVRGAGADVEPSWTDALASTGGKSGKNVNIFSLPC